MVLKTANSSVQEIVCLILICQKAKRISEWIQNILIRILILCRTYQVLRQNGRHICLRNYLPARGPVHKVNYFNQAH